MLDLFMKTGAVVLITALSACVPPPQPVANGGLEAGPAPKIAAPKIVSFAPNLLEVDIDGAAVKAVPPRGVCISPDSVQTFPRAVFAVYEECAGSRARKLGGDLSLSISNAPMEEDLKAMGAFFETDAGLAGLGFNGSSKGVSLVETAMDKNAIYAVVEDRSQSGPAFAGDLICRAFTGINGRMVVVSLVSRKGQGLNAGEMQKQVQEIVTALQKANGQV